ncbi:MAG TPA: YfdX family protein [Gammaproteobacteria bacterium]|nr:YfdX family protein [Gammaproteobacteria bacterium]
MAAESPQAKAEAQPQKEAVQQQVDKRAAGEREKIIQEAIAAVSRTSKAIRALDRGDKDQALEELATAIGKLELITTAYPELALAPLDVQLVTHDLAGSVEEVEKAIAKARDLLDDGRVQDARLLLRDLASEVVIRTVNVPLATYPDAIKAVVPLIKDGKVKEAKAALATALSTLVVVDHVIPLPVLRAEAALADAKALAANAKRKPEEAKKLADLLAAARTQLELAEVLGYGEKDAFKPFYDDIAAIEKATKGGGTEQGLFDSLKKRFEELKKKL